MQDYDDGGEGADEAANNGQDANEDKLPNITPEMEDDINAALSLPSSVTLVSAFREGGFLYTMST